MTGNERIALALERIADKLDFFEELAKKEMAEECEEDVSIKKSDLTPIFIDKNKFSDVYMICQDTIEKYGRVRVGDVKQASGDYSVCMANWRYGWLYTSNMKFRDLKNGVIELSCDNACFLE